MNSGQEASLSPVTGLGYEFSEIDEVKGFLKQKFLGIR